MTTVAKPIGVKVPCSCCGIKTMAMEYPDRFVVKTHGHVLVIQKSLTSRES